MRKITLGVRVGNRGFFPAHLCETGRKTVLDMLKSEGIGAVADALRQAGLDVPVWVHAFPDDAARMTVRRRRDTASAESCRKPPAPCRRRSASTCTGTSITTRVDVRHPKTA